MRKKSPRHLFCGWLMLFGMLFHVLVTHHDGASELLLGRHAEGLADGRFVPGSPVHHAHHPAEVHHQDAGHHQDATHHHLSLEHPDAYICPSSTEAQDLLALRLSSLLASLPLRTALPQTPLRLASVWQLPEPQPPPEQRRLALTTTILLI